MLYIWWRASFQGDSYLNSTTVLFDTHKHRQCFNCYIVLPGRLARSNLPSTQTAAIFGDQDISKCLTNLFLVVEQANRIRRFTMLCT